MESEELKLARQGLKEAKAHLVRWNYLGKHLRKTESLAWSAMKKIREGEVELWRLLIKRILSTRC